MQTLLDFVGERLGPWSQEARPDPPEITAGQGAGHASAASCPSGSATPSEQAGTSGADMAAAINHTVEKLGVGPHADFDHVVAALRTRTGALDETEACLLFLDEWRKQYLQ